jgi:hypothetical protein
MLDKTKTFNGPFDLVLLAAAVEKYTVSGLKKDSVALSVEPQSEELEDNSKDLYAYLAKAEVSFSELDTTDLESIQDKTIDHAEIRFTSKGKKIVIAGPTNIIPSVDGLKTKISIEKFSASPNISDAFAIEAIS